jgi:4-amino-4-deoxy-L-arabinose transferase-like glycosyltransferase
VGVQYVNRRLPGVPLWWLYWAALVLIPLLVRTYMPIDETRYMSVAWDMLLRGDFLVPHLNGRVYSDKPPLLFWIINLGWAVTGVNDIWPRLVSPLFGAASLLLTSLIARKLWPGDRETARLAPLVTVSSGLWMFFVSAVMFDMLMAFFTLLGVLGIILCWKHADRKGWILLGLAIGLGMLAKGPVILVHTLPLALLAPWWAMDHRPERWASWYAGILVSVCIGTVMTLTWAVPAAFAGGKEYSNAIFWGQTAGRVAHSFAHKRPLWWYVPLLPLILFPWLLWPALWRSFRSLVHAPPSTQIRICVAWIVPVFIIFSLISGKQPHYLLPLYPAFGLLSSCAVRKFPSYRAYDALLPGAFILIVGIILSLYDILPLPAAISLQLSDMNQCCGIILIATGLMIPVMYHLNVKRGGAAVISLSGITLITVLYISLIGVFPYYDMRSMSSYVGRLQRSGIPVAYLGKYHGTFNFLGRLYESIDVITDTQVLKWASQHPDGRVIADEEDLQPGKDVSPEYERPYGLHTLKSWKGSSLSRPGS